MGPSLKDHRPLQLTSDAGKGVEMSTVPEDNRSGLLRVNEVKYGGQPNLKVSGNVSSSNYLYKLRRVLVPMLFSAVVLVAVAAAASVFLQY